MINTTKESFKFFLIASLTLGLAPFFPEPHIIGKIRWVIGGGHGMETMDYLDLLLHGTPWVGMIISVILNLKKWKK